jgi:hypothetical protein
MGSALKELTTSAAKLPDDMGAARAFVSHVYAISTEHYTDEHFQALEERIAGAIQLLARSPEPEARELTKALEVALSGVREGLPPDPAKRPSRESLAARFESAMKELGF